MNKQQTKIKNRGTLKIKRPSFPEDEKLQPWLSILLDAYDIVDRGVAQAVEAGQKRGRTLACRRGCSYCCRTHRDVPVYPLELVGISWYVTEKITGPERGMLMEQLKNYSSDGTCPFLLNDYCLIHPLRPIACRQFNVFGKPCIEGEDPYYTRREDVMPPVKKHVDQAFFVMLPFYGVEKESERIKIIEKGEMHRMVRVLQSCNWKSLAGKIDDFDRKTTGDNSV
jgi:Fe-S-cluster containining protein